MRTANLALKFLLELAAIAAVAVAGWQVGGTAGLVLAVLLPAAVVVVWGLFCAPRASRRLPTARRVPVELGIFVAGAAALLLAGHPAWAAAMTVAIGVNTLGLTAYGQWEA